MRPSNINTANGKNLLRNGVRCSRSMRERWSHWAINREYYLSHTHTHTADPAKPCGPKGISHSRSLPIPLTRTNTHARRLNCHRTFNVATLSTSGVDVLFCQESKSRKRHKEWENGQQRKMSVWMTSQCFKCPQRKTESMSLLGLCNLLPLLWDHRRYTQQL